ncbi:CDP-diacylglycerol--serine O-phosphatidyltransferase [Rhodobium orientis]|uniref:CDP-diacylglycerol--serine O-phosphatidyltransferase n=1 Tax=Rhodobium orientis TaxID=34017 RepID=A0A327JVJ7_9HYPH|nr:CDP-diacylglycerol--serine O-phosphatidyltransferase [Rhodobium orientis]MBB4304015.1 CDP-diacylglycerol--serine O-phosphatidyltransferase [Rhodobium orientis]MBK5950775.1 CDP-diacylglycerol--serine O-phosphatidyltransferase [Rhodobium orientis]RAI29554.1 CDP-diacylglycerol--serine O-phosphatidyltransferase [Rhodobium orientis]
MDWLFPPFDPGRRRRSRRYRFRRLPLRVILPNVVTLLALCSGLTAIRMALESRFDWAIAAILLAALLDAVDGRVARLLKGTSRFGAELDSLADFVNFGVAPAIILYIWLLNEARGLGWIVVLIFAIAAALRLARFNVALDDAAERRHWQVDFFVGMPAPAGALTVLLPVYLALLDLVTADVYIVVPVILHILFTAFMMVSNLPTYSGKRIGARVHRNVVLPLLVAVVMTVALVVSYPFVMLSLGVLAYLVTLPIAWNDFRRRMTRDRDRDAGKANG